MRVRSDSERGTALLDCGRTRRPCDGHRRALGSVSHESWARFASNGGYALRLGKRSLFAQTPAAILPGRSSTRPDFRVHTD
jgi:hypothetical protein